MNINTHNRYANQPAEITVANPADITVTNATVYALLGICLVHLEGLRAHQYAQDLLAEATDVFRHRGPSLENLLVAAKNINLKIELC